MEYSVLIQRFDPDSKYRKLGYLGITFQSVDDVNKFVADRYADRTRKALMYFYEDDNGEPVPTACHYYRDPQICPNQDGDLVEVFCSGEYVRMGGWKWM